MIIGTRFFGKIKKHENQWIETKFIVIGFPLIPIQSMFVTSVKYNKRNGLEIGLYGPSLRKAYFGIWGLLLGAILAFAGMKGGFIVQLLGITLFITSLYYTLRFGDSTETENAERVLYEKATGINALPEYLDQKNLVILRDRMIECAVEKSIDKDVNWLRMVERNNYNAEQLPFLFAAMGYHRRMDKSDKNERLYEELKAKFTKQLA